MRRCQFSSRFFFINHRLDVTMYQCENDKEIQMKTMRFIVTIT
jgi:hypothetical protein